MANILRGTPAGLLIYDLDNTLLACSECYSEARAEFSALMAHELGVSATHALEEFFAFDAAEQRRVGFTDHRFRDSMIAVHALLAAEQGRSVRPEIRERVAAIGDSIHSYTYPPYPGGLETAARYREAGWRVGICTKGSPGTQEPKIQRWGLRERFDVIRVVPHKDVDIVRAVRDELAGGADATRLPSWMVGDSRRDDILPAQTLGMSTVLVTGTGHSNKHHETGFEHVEPTHAIDRVHQLPEVCPAAPAHLRTPEPRRRSMAR